MLPTKFENRQSLKVKNFNHGFSVKLCAEGKGFAVRLAQFNGEFKSWFRFDKTAAETIFTQVCKEFSK